MEQYEWNEEFQEWYHQLDASLYETIPPQYKLEYQQRQQNTATLDDWLDTILWIRKL